MNSPSRYKTYIENGTYHIYNRGVAKMKFFNSEKDYKVYLRYLKFYLLPKNVLIKELLASKAGHQYKMRELSRVTRLSNFSESVTLHAFCLMPNHIHLVVKQRRTRDISYFIRSLHTRYAKYFNAKYERIGPLFQDRFSAKYIPSDKDLVRLSRYVHRNPVNITQGITKYPWGSLKYYKNRRNPSWLDISRITKAFKASAYTRSYSSYISYVNDSH